VANRTGRTSPTDQASVDARSEDTANVFKPREDTELSSRRRSPIDAAAEGEAATRSPLWPSTSLAATR
jgi:hypothetical protein